MDLMPEPELYCTNMSIIRPLNFSKVGCQKLAMQTVVPVKVGPHLNRFGLRPMVTKLLLCMHASVSHGHNNQLGAIPPRLVQGQWCSRRAAFRKLFPLLWHLGHLRLLRALVELRRCEGRFLRAVLAVGHDALLLLKQLLIDGGPPGQLLPQLLDVRDGDRRPPGERSNGLRIDFGTTFVLVGADSTATKASPPTPRRVLSRKDGHLRHIRERSVTYMLPPWSWSVPPPPFVPVVVVAD